MAIFNYKGGYINYTIQGSGDPVVLIHGFGLDSRMWKKQAEELSKTNNVVTYDMRGFGKSSLPTGKYSHQEDLHELLKSLGITETKIVGHSFGGEVGIEYALKYPYEVSSLVLISSGLGGVNGDTTEWDALTMLGGSGDIEGMRERMLRNPIFKDLKEGSEEWNLVKEMANDYTGFHFQNSDPREYTDVGGRLKELSCPVKIIIGENDEEIQKEIAEKFKKELGIEPIIIPNCGHMAVLENPELVTEIISKV